MRDIEQARPEYLEGDESNPYLDLSGETDDEPELATIDRPIYKYAKKNFNIDYLFPYQQLIIQNILTSAGYYGVARQDSVESKQIVLLPTGAGKSLCFMLPAAMLDRPSLVIFPLLSLIADQARRVSAAGITVAILKGGQSSAERQQIWADLAANKIKMLLSNPETICSSAIVKKLQNLDIAHLVIDEAHTVSEWGDSFRPAYLQLEKFIAQVPIRVITAFTATASQQILSRIQSILFTQEAAHLIIGNPDRSNIHYSVLPVLNKNESLRLLALNMPRPMIIFAASRLACEKLALELRQSLADNNIRFYHAGLPKTDKEYIEKWFFAAEDAILISTCAYGMGVDKSNIRCVIHRDIPISVEAYLQESGRGGRDKKPAQAILLYSQEDEQRLQKLDEKSRRRFEKLLAIARDYQSCRRVGFLALLDAAPAYCSGCDVCDKSSLQQAPEQQRILSAIGKLHTVITAAELVLVLKGYLSKSILAYGLRFHRCFAILEDWSLESIGQFVQELQKKRPRRNLDLRYFAKLLKDFFQRLSKK